jgi:hypothetical protein
MTLKATSGPYGIFDDPAVAWVNTVFAGENLLQTILHAHLLIERALHAKIAQKLARPEVLDSTALPRLSFGQKMTIFVGLYDPEPACQSLLASFNRLRNALAHDLIEPETAVGRHLRPALDAAMKADRSASLVLESANSVVQVVFLLLMLVYLGAVDRVERIDNKSQGST